LGAHDPATADLTRANKERETARAPPPHRPRRHQVRFHPFRRISTHIGVLSIPRSPSFHPWLNFGIDFKGAPWVRVVSSADLAQMATMAGLNLGDFQPNSSAALSWC
jgi:hypothetical protein